MRIGIVGTGIAGLTTGWLLKNAGHEVTLFEKHTVLGMDAHSVDFEIEGKQFRSDVPPRMFNRAQWPKLFELYEEIGVEHQSVAPTKSFSKLGEAAVLNLSQSYLPKLSPSLLLNPATRAILSDVRRMMAVATDEVNKAELKQQQEPDWIEPSIGEYLAANQYSDEFVGQFFYPAISSTVCTCSYESLQAFPASVLLNALLNITKSEGLFRTSNGTQDVVERLSAGIQDIRLNTAVDSVAKIENSVTVGLANGEILEFDHVVIATQANVAASLVNGLGEQEKETLRSFKYENVETVVHTDDRLMPNRKKDWANFNLISNRDCTAAMCTIWLNKFYPEWKLDQPVFQTIMPIQQPDRAKLICTAKMQRPVVDSNTIQAHQNLKAILAEPNRRIWFCGSYATPGIPLLESGVCSGFLVADRLQTISTPSSSERTIA